MLSAWHFLTVNAKTRQCSREVDLGKPQTGESMLHLKFIMSFKGPEMGNFREKLGIVALEDYPKDSDPQVRPLEGHFRSRTPSW